jgi:hypothetical protein
MVCLVLREVPLRESELSANSSQIEAMQDIFLLSLHHPPDKSHKTL